MSRGTRVRGVIRVAIAGTAQDNAISPNAVQEAINRHFTLLGDAASQYGGTVEHLSGSERLYMFLDAPKTLAAANAMLTAAVRINAMRPQSEPSLLHRFASDFGSTTVEERLLRGQARTFTAGEAVQVVDEMMESVPAGQVWATQNLMDEAAKFGHTAKVQSVQPMITKSGASIAVVQVISFLSDVSTATTATSGSSRSSRKQAASPAAERLLKTTIRLAVLAAIAIGGYVFVQSKPKMFADLQHQWNSWTKSMSAPKHEVKKPKPGENSDSGDAKKRTGTVTIDTAVSEKPAAKSVASKHPSAPSGVAKPKPQTPTEKASSPDDSNPEPDNKDEDEVKNGAEENPNADPSAPPPDHQ
jgi:hypothetical protein